MNQLLEKPEALVIDKTPAELGALLDMPAYGEDIPTDSIGKEVQQLIAPIESHPSPSTESRMSLGQTALGLANKAAFTATQLRQGFYSFGDRVTRKIEGASKKPNIARIAASRLVALSVILVAAGAVVKPAGEHLDSIHFQYDSLPDGLDAPIDSVDSADFSPAAAQSETIAIHDVSVQAGEGSEHWFDRAGFTHEQAHELAYSTSDDAMDTKEGMVKDGSAYWADKKHGVVGLMGDVKDIDAIQKYADTLTPPDTDASDVETSTPADTPAHTNESMTPAHPPKVHTIELEPIIVPDSGGSADPTQPDTSIVHEAWDKFMQWQLGYKVASGVLALGTPFVLSSPIVKAHSRRVESEIDRKKQARYDELQVMWMSDPEAYRQTRLDEAAEVYVTLRKKLKNTDGSYYKKYIQIYTEVINRLKTEAFPFLDGEDLRSEVTNIARQLSKAIGVEKFHTDDGVVNPESLRDTRPMLDRIFKGELPAQKEYVERAKAFNTTPNTDTERVPLDTLLV